MKKIIFISLLTVILSSCGLKKNLEAPAPDSCTKTDTDCDCK